MADRVIPKKFASNPKGKVISVKIRVKVVPPPNSIEYIAAFDEGFFKKRKPKTGTKSPDTMNA